MLQTLQWGGQDSNLRRQPPADLQSAPFDRSGTSPTTNIIYAQSPTLQVTHPLLRFSIVAISATANAITATPNAITRRNRS